MTNADPGWQIRHTCLAAIRQCEQAEQKARQATEAAAKKRQTAKANAQQKHSALRQEAQSILNELRQQAREGDKIMGELGLSPAPLASPSLPSPGIGLNDLMASLRNRRAEARQGLAKLKTTAAELREERRKWWKFW